MSASINYTTSGSGKITGFKASSNTSNTFRVTNTTVTRGGCNESKVHDNDEKAVFHGMKAAFRMSREFDGREYGSQSPQHDHAARIAANVALAYIDAKEVDYDREESFEYVTENVLDDQSVLDKILAVFHGECGVATATDLEDGIARAWEQIDGKSHHDDGARTALAIAELYTGERLYDDQ